ncbi:MAG: hypothetical protein ACO2PM_12570 [Pyrobaculum sp.]|jgi:hypothetical protein
MVQTQNQAAAERAAGAGAGPGLATEQGPVRRIVFLNALPLNALPRSHLRLDILPVSIAELAQWAQRRVAEGYEVVHFIRHPATIAALRAVGIPLSEQPSSGLYQYAHGDVIVVVTLRAPQRGQEVQQVSPQDLEVWVVAVL